MKFCAMIFAENYGADFREDLYMPKVPFLDAISLDFFGTNFNEKRYMPKMLIRPAPRPNLLGTNFNEKRYKPKVPIHQRNILKGDDSEMVPIKRIAP